MEEKQSVAIIGAGISGLLACKYTIQKGFHPIVFESQTQIGGVWAKTLESTRLQTPRTLYQFTDFPWPSSVKDPFPFGTEVLEYIKSYAQHFGLFSYIKFDSKVVGVDYVGESSEEMEGWDFWGGCGKAFGSKGKWLISVQHFGEPSLKEYEADFLILCNGRFSGHPNIPEFPKNRGPEVFGGKVLHSMDYSAMDSESVSKLVKGKRVAVVGAAKSAVDIAAECASANGVDVPCTMIYRTVDWMIQDYNVWGVNLALVYLNRFGELLVHKPGETLFSSVLATLLSPVRWGISKLVESYLKRKFPLKKYGLVPKHSFHKNISACNIFLTPENFFGKIEDGSIVLRKAESFSFCREGLVLEGEAEPLEMDVVILATGFRGDLKLQNVFTSQTFKKYIMGSSNSTIPLYRQMIHPRIPQLAVIGYSESLANLYTFEIRCQWLAHFLDQAFALPSIKDMEKEVAAWEDYMKKNAGDDFRRSCIGVLHVCYNDQLCKDIGCNHRRKKNFIAELIEPYGPADYAGLNPES